MMLKRRARRIPPSCFVGFISDSSIITLYQPAGTGSERPVSGATWDASKLSCANLILQSVNVINALVLGLLFYRCPAAIARFVVTERINSVNAQPLRSLTHVPKEIFKNVPVVAYADSFHSVVFIILAGGIVATSFHSTPTLISLTGLLPNGVPVPEVVTLLKPAPTMERGLKMLGLLCAGIAAIAQADPCCSVPINARAWFNAGKHSELLSCKIAGAFHR